MTTPNLLLFVGQHCAPCKVIKPRVRQTATELALPLTELVIEEPETDVLRDRYDVGSVPTLVVLKDDVPRSYVGLQPIMAALRELNPPVQ